METFRSWIIEKALKDWSGEHKEKTAPEKVKDYQMVTISNGSLVSKFSRESIDIQLRYSIFNHVRLREYLFERLEHHLIDKNSFSWLIRIFCIHIFHRLIRFFL